MVLNSDRFSHPVGAEDENSISNAIDGKILAAVEKIGRWRGYNVRLAAMAMTTMA